MWGCRWYYWADKLGMLVWQDMPNMPYASHPSPPGHSPACMSAAAAVLCCYCHCCCCCCLEVVRCPALIGDAFLIVVSSKGTICIATQSKKEQCIGCMLTAYKNLGTLCRKAAI